MTKPTGVREIIEGIEKDTYTDGLGDWIDKDAFDKVVAIALKVEEQRDSLLKQLCFVCDKAGFNLVAPLEIQLSYLNAEIAKGET